MDAPTEIIGIDPGLRMPAVAALDPKSGSVLRCSSFRGTADTTIDMSTRAHGIAIVLARYVAQVPGPKVIGLEGPAYNVRMRRGSMEQLARCRQALFSVLLFSLPDLIFMEIPPASVKVSICGKGNATKIDVVNAVLRQYDVALSNNNISRCAQADAIATAHCALNRWRRKL